MCRWETVAETEVSEQIENKSTNEESATVQQRPIKIISRKMQRTQVNIADFSLLQIPSNIDINFIIKEIIVPRLPDGYTIALSEPKQLTSSSKNQTTSKKNSKQVHTLKDFLISTNSPRQLHPKRKLKFDVHIIVRKVNESKSNECDYLFSQLLRDLDDLHEKQQPLDERHMDEISENLSVSLSDDASNVSDTQLNADDSLHRSEEFPWQLTKRDSIPEATPTVNEVVDSDDDGGADDDDDDLDECDQEKFVIKPYESIQLN